MIDILFVEDSSDDAELTLRALEKHHLVNKVHVARDGVEALDYVFRRGDYETRDKNSDPKLILLDLRLPKINGLQVLKELKSNDQTKHIPVVILTSSTMESDRKACYSLGANSFITKPVDFENFMEVVSALGYYWLIVNKPLC